MDQSVELRHQYGIFQVQSQASLEREKDDQRLIRAREERQGQGKVEKFSNLVPVVRLA